jgi:hypothetical protein
VLGRGRGDAELNAAVKMLENDVSASPVAIATNERFIQIMVTVGSCLRSPTRDVKDRGHCYKHVFVGLGLDRDAPKPPKKPNVNTWDTCARRARERRAGVAPRERFPHRDVSLGPPSRRGVTSTDESVGNNRPPINRHSRRFYALHASHRCAVLAN